MSARVHCDVHGEFDLKVADCDICTRKRMDRAEKELERLAWRLNEVLQELEMNHLEEA